MEHERRETHEEIHAREERERRERMEEAGRKGGAAAMATAGVPAARAGEVAVPIVRDRVRWAPVWAGFLTAMGIQLVLGAIGLAVALGAYNPASANYAENVSRTLGIWSAISALIALFVGGYIAGRMAAVAGLRNGLTQGTMVWALALVLGTLLSALGITGLLGAAANIAPNLSQIVARGPGVDMAQVRAAVDATTRGAWYFVIGSILAWLAAAGGGMLGASQRLEEIEEEA